MGARSGRSEFSSRIVSIEVALINWNAIGKLSIESGKERDVSELIATFIFDIINDF